MLETSRLILKPAEIGDAENLFQLCSDPDVMKYSGDLPYQSSFHAGRFIQEKMIPQFEDKKMGRFMVFLKNGTFLGWCGLKDFPDTNEVDLGYRFMKRYWGQGFAQEASMAALAYGFETLKLFKIMAKVMPENTRSIKLLQRLGMTFRGYVNDPSDPCPFIVYDLTQDQYRKCAAF